MKTATLALFVFALTANAVAALLFTPLIAEEEKNMETPFTRISYNDLKGRQQENYNFHKVASAMADFGYNAMWLNDDWENADFIAVHIDGATMLRVQLKGRFGFDKKYRGKNLWIAFRDSKTGEIYIYPHDELLSHYIGRLEKTAAWRNGGNYHFPSRTPDDEKLLAPYRLTNAPTASGMSGPASDGGPNKGNANRVPANTGRKRRADPTLRKVQYRKRILEALKASGYQCDLLPDNDEADFRVRHQDGGAAFKVRVFGRCFVWQKRRNDSLRHAFCDSLDSKNCKVYMFPHDKLWDLLDQGRVGKNAPPSRWKNNCRHWPDLTNPVREVLVDNGFVLRT